MFARLLCCPLYAAILLGAQFTSSIAAQDPQPPAVMSALQGTQAQSTPEGTAPAAAPQTIYIPYTKLREVFEKEGRGVFLPHSEFQKLWDAARAKPTQPEQSPPLDALITAADNEAVIEQDVVRVSATLTVELLKKGWLQVPLRLNDVALQSATIGGETARVTPAAAGGYQLLIHHEDDKPRSLELKLEYARAFTKAPGQNSVAFDAPQAPINRWRIRVSQAGVKINVHPFIAATDGSHKAATPDSRDEATPPKEKGENEAEETVGLAFVGSAPRVTIDWTPKAEGATGLAALATVQATQEVFVTENTLRTRAMLRYDISRSSLTELKVDVPADYKVVNVFDANLRKWEVAAQDNVQRITVQLFEPASTTQNVSIELEKFLEAESHSELHAPVIKAVDVGRQQGVVVVNVEAALRAEVTARTGLLQLDAAELPPTLSSQPWTFAYRYAALPFDLALSLMKVEPRITVEQFVEAHIEPEILAMDVLAIFDIAEAGVFQLEFELPSDIEVRQVTGRDYPGATAASVDAHHIEDTDPTRLIINLNKKAFGKTCVALRLEQRLTDANLLTPTGTPANIPVVVPRANQEHLSRVNGRLLLSAPESLRINPQATTGLRAISLSEATTGLQSLREGRFPSTRLALAFAFTDQAANFNLSAERRKPYVTAQQRMLVSVDSGVVRFQSMILYDILYSGVNSLRVDVPSDIAADIRNETAGIRETRLEPQPDDVAEGYIAWSLTGQSELIGRQSIVLSWERKIEELVVGKSIDVSVPYLQPMLVDRGWGQVVLTKTETLDVQPKGELVGLRPIDPQHDIIPEASVANAARAFEFHDDWSLQLNVTRYKLEEIKHTSIERALVRMVITRSSQVGVQAQYRLRSAHQRLTLTLPADIVFDSQPARINGVPVSLERGDKEELHIPLAGHDPDQSLILELRYSYSGSGRELELPLFPEDPAVQKVYLNVYVPEERTLIGWSGPWTEEWNWQSQNMFDSVPVPVTGDDQLTSWVTEGVSVAASPPFQRDGTLYSFSALKPQPAPQGSLRLWTINGRILVGIVLCVLAALALGLLRSSLKTKIMAITALLILVVLIGSLAPTFAQQLMSFPLLAGLTIAVLAWCGWYAYHAASRFQDHSSPPFEPAEEQPLPATTVEGSPVAGGDHHA